jgi:TolB-like protein/Tfp pilus assembly protein PilF
MGPDPQRSALPKIGKRQAMKIDNFFSELRRRNVYKVAVAYAVVAWLLIQIATQVFPFFEIPNWAVRLVVLLLIISFPIALIIAWAFELTPQGLKRTEAADRKPAKPSRNRAWIYVVIIAAAVSVGLFFVGRYSARTNRPTANALPLKSIAVLPFENLSGEPANAYFADGIQEEILTRLSKIADLKVISRTSTQRFKSAPSNLLDIARQLGVAHILEGSAQRSADQVRVNVQLIDAATDAHLWAETYDRKLTDIFAVETEIAAKIADVLQAKLTGAEHRAIAARPTENNEAHDLYLKGRYFVAKRTGDDVKRAIDCFNQAIGKDPNYALAYAGLANSYSLLPQYSNLPVTEALPKARVAAEKALSIDNNLAEARVARGLVLLDEDFNLKEAKREFERALELNPNYADAHYWLGLTVLAPLGQLDQAVVELKRAVELDPVSVIMNTNFGLCYILARRYPEAITQLRKTTELDPNFDQTHRFLGLALELSGDSAGAIREYEKAYEVAKAHPTGAKDVGSPWLARAYALRGEREKALQLLGQLEYLERRNGRVFIYGLATVHLRLGQKEQAIDWLERSYLEKEMVPMSFIKVNPELDPLRGDPRFERLANQIIPPGDAR